MNDLIVVDKKLWDELIMEVKNLAIQVQKLVKLKEGPSVLTHKGAAAYLGYTSAGLHNLKNARKIPFSQCGRKIMYRREDLDQFMEEYRVNLRKRY